LDWAAARRSTSLRLRPQGDAAGRAYREGFCTVSPDKEAVDLFRSEGGGAKPVAGGTKVCWGEDERAARGTAHRLWPNEQLPGELAQILPTPAHFEQASELVSEDAVAEAIPCGPDLELHLQSIECYRQAGFDELYIQQVGGDHERFFEVFANEVLPRFRQSAEEEQRLAATAAQG
jgi:G6PDH family F420-dependent oxidoreductase